MEGMVIHILSFVFNSYFCTLQVMSLRYSVSSLKYGFGDAKVCLRFPVRWLLQQVDAIINSYICSTTVCRLQFIYNIQERI